MILAIDTATQYAGLALYNQDRLYAEEMWLTDRNHTIELMPRIVRMLTLAEIAIPELTGLAVAIGPGSFTGLRIGLAAAKGMALPHKLPLIGVPTLDVVSFPWRHRGLQVWAIVQAGRGRILTASYRWIDQQWQRQDQPRLTNFKTLATQIDQPALCVGEIDEAGAQALEQGSHRKARIVSPAARLRRAGYLAEIAAERLASGDWDDPDTLEPIYPSPL